MLTDVCISWGWIFWRRIDTLRKAEYKRVSGKTNDIRERLYYKGIYCISSKNLRWCKRSLNRIYRRKHRREIDV